MEEAPTIISVAHQKGGVGKSTLAYNLATYFAKQGDKCAIVDADFQGTITDLFNAFGKEGILGKIKLIDKKQIKKYNDLLSLVEYDLLVIDTPPYISTDLDSIFNISDFILIPMKPAVNDFLAIDRTLNFAKACKKNRPDVKVGIIMNMVVSKSSFADDIRKELKTKGKGFTVLKSEVGQRIEFTRYHLYTDSIFGTSDKKAQTEIENLGKEILQTLQTPQA